MKKALILATIIAASSNVYAEKAGFFVGPQIGNVSIKLKDDFAIQPSEYDEDNLELGVSAGFRFTSGITFEGLYLVSDSIDFLDVSDTYNFDQFQLMTGYRFKPSERIHIIPKIGVSFWELDGAEGAFFNPGDEATSDFSGSDFIWSLNAEFPLSRIVTLHFSYNNNNYEFGESNSLSAGVKFEF